ncbi:hypothetical protein TcasGA2_TC006176 [Tribolium castaneum]|uniref:Ig-like domain-containing protein n=1 Tax=Tribolium castaneum TaxID=7070 RepID=D6WV15_TRICA|nr:hypothetical protein TcasGA2_TC006176 [Tribolium castaneum]
MFGTTVVCLIAALQILVDNCLGLRLTNMTAPALQDPRRDMELHCRFDMGGEELYAVKWYKDDHEFFRYTPAAAVSITQFPVDGVHVDRQNSRCMPEGCDLLLKELSRPQSSGAYRCEVSSEAPAFRLASQTHNVTVAGEIFYMELNHDVALVVVLIFLLLTNGNLVLQTSSELPEA